MNDGELSDTTKNHSGNTTVSGLSSFLFLSALVCVMNITNEILCSTKQ